MNINIIRPSVEIKSIKLKDVKAGDVFYIQGADDVPFLKTKLRIPDFTNRYSDEYLIGAMNLTNGNIIDFTQDTYVRLYKKTKLTIEV
jgi:hypothetical protein|uniref:Uncharacterized protein n=1 Tax=Phage sp. ctGns7 TaxID=2828003 RepID=A0A8S5S992_9VIRU|nr:MAG TPA: hypothetical protein [Phage sp. ctGns7]